MDFLIKLHQSDLGNLNLKDLQGSDRPIFVLNGKKSAFPYKQFFAENFKFHVFGDLIFPKEISDNLETQNQYLFSNFLGKSLSKLAGFYYVVVINLNDNLIEVHSSFLSILPVYYYNHNNKILVSGSLSEIFENIFPRPNPNPLYIVEKALFNYAFLHNTPFKYISLLPSCHYLEISSKGIRSLQTYTIGDFIVEQPIPWKKNLNALSEVYRDEIVKYIPVTPFAITLTGGFDGRTILSAALKSKADIHLFSYGSSEDLDITIPKSIAKSFGFDYTPFLINDDYAIKRFWQDGQDFLMKSEGTGNISRAHYSYTANELSKKFDYLLTGNFGSELIRSLKDPSVMASKVLFALFDMDSFKEFETYIKKYNSLSWIKTKLIEENIDEVINVAWNYKETLPKKYTKNQKFYCYVFGEVFRKYFGAEIVMQSESLLNRSPFLDYNIFKSTLRLSLAGVYQDFREKSLVKRFHGQILYSHLLKKLYPPLLNINLDRNYKPFDFLTSFGRISIIAGYFKQNYSHKRNKNIPSYSQLLYSLNSHEIRKILEVSEFLHKELMLKILDSGEWKSMQHEFVNLVSMELFFHNNTTV